MKIGEHYNQGSTKTLFCFKNQPFCFQNVFCPKRVFKTRFKTRHLFQSLCPRFAIFLFQMFLFCFDFLDVVDVVFQFCRSQCVKYSLLCFCFCFIIGEVFKGDDCLALLSIILYFLLEAFALHVLLFSLLF